MRTRRLPRDHAVVFARVVSELRVAVARPEVRLTEVPAPGRIAPYAYAVTADVSEVSSDEDLATGRFVLLYDPAAPAPWDGQWRVVTFARAELEPELATDPLLGAVGWSWLMDAIDSVQAQVTAEAGTVTRVVSESFAGLDERPPSVEMEIRASWTPTDDDPARHLQAWLSLVCTIAGLPPLPDGVVALPGQRR
ncbi:MAG: DUF3000 domain-containing protein [Candidatus Lutibacillus vidarii]|nr:DUF3000 domain-containing protein [Candidatus Lutibacillus vidarii]HON74858.1 DUF3000 domain-containing protein [Dermatophilaceae bacterium]HRB99417.1 DUF3000 domain-containing protein [Dermatophilaceae bacterium]